MRIYYQCVVCRKLWYPHEVHDDPESTATIHTCGDLTCGGLCQCVPARAITTMDLRGAGPFGTPDWDMSLGNAIEVLKPDGGIIVVNDERKLESARSAVARLAPPSIRILVELEPDASARIVTPAEVLGLIDPIDPDTLNHIGNGVYEARWFPPVPQEEIEALRAMDGVTVSDEPFVPEGLPAGWTAVRFTVNVPNQPTT